MTKEARVSQVASMRIRLKYPDVETFIQKYARNISRGGIFISTKQPKPVGTRLRFEFILVGGAEQHSILRGEGVVQWTKEFNPDAPGKHGMGLKFIHIDEDSQEVVDRALASRQGPAVATPARAAAEDRSDEPGIAATPAAPPAATKDPEPSSAPEATREPDAATAPVALPASDAPDRQAVSSGGDPADPLAIDWGVSDEQLARTLRRPRQQVSDETEELRRLLIRPELPTPTRREAIANLRGLLERRQAGLVLELPGSAAADEVDLEGDEGRAVGDQAVSAQGKGAR